MSTIKTRLIEINGVIFRLDTASSTITMTSEDETQVDTLNFESYAEANQAFYALCASFNVLPALITEEDEEAKVNTYYFFAGSEELIKVKRKSNSKNLEIYNWIESDEIKGNYSWVLVDILEYDSIEEAKQNFYMLATAMKAKEVITK